MLITCVDSICVKCLNAEKILYGLGNNLCLFDGENQTFCDVKPRDKIHQIDFLEIQSKEFRIICSAGREILYVELKDDKFVKSSVSKINEWISCLKFYKDGTFGLITAHNYAVHMKAEKNSVIVLEQSICKDNSTLYCAHIDGSTFEDSLFFTGTALGELLVWSPKEGSKILFRINAHNGVIFSIATNLNKSLLVTASDDRSIKIWNVVDSDGGFSLKLAKQSFGHLARVFVTKIFEYKNQILVTSAGEDSNICIWDTSGNLMVKKNISYSGTIWDLDYNPSTKTLVTSSSNGKLNKFSLDQILATKSEENIFQVDNDFPAKVKFVENGEILVVVTSKNRFFYRNHQIFGSSWKEFEISENFSVTLLESSGDKIFLTEKNRIHIFEWREKFGDFLRSSLLTIDQGFEGSPEFLGYYFIRTLHILNFKEFLICDNSGKCLLLDFGEHKILGSFLLPKCPEPWTTAALKLKDFILIGDRNGKLHLFDVPKESSQNGPTIFRSPLDSIKKVHGNLGITNILLISQTQDNFLVKSTGNDGTTKVLQISPKSSKKLEVFTTEKTLVNYIEKIVENRGKFFIFGFNDDYLVVYEKQNGILFEARVGGRHRNWDLICDELGRVRISYIQKKCLRSLEFLLEENILLDNHWHIKECNRIVVRKLREQEFLMVSGGEDNVLKFNTLNFPEQKMINFSDVFTHISSIKTIFTVNINEELWIFSAGGRAQIVASRLSGASVKDEISYMLTADKHGIHFKNINTFDPETRFTCMEFRDNLLFVGCSDGFLRIFKFFLESKEISFVQEVEYGRCFLHCYFLGDFLLTMATDGFICFWKFDGTCLEIVEKLKHNQSGINSFDLREDGDSWLLVTGGDDQSIFLSRIKITDNSIQVLETKNTNQIHSAQVTGLKFVDQEFLLSTSIDQTICKLNIETLELIEKRETCVSDVKGFILIPFEEKILIWGAGMEIVPSF